MNYPESFIQQFSKMSYQEIIILYKKCKEEREKNKKFDYDKVYKSTVKFYIDKKGYSKDQANDIAKKVVEKQQMEWSKK